MLGPAALSLIPAAIIPAALTAAAIQSRREGDTRAAGRLFGLAPLLAAPWFIAGLVSAPWAIWFAIVPLGGSVLLLIALLLPLGNPAVAADPVSEIRLDERDTMFSRHELVPGSDREARHYARRPEHRAQDESWRRRPGLLAPGSGCYDPLQFGAASASVTALEALRPLVDGKPAPERIDLDPHEATTFLKGWSLRLGALDARITRLQPHHLYGVSGRAERYDQPVTLDHPWALAITTPMAKDALDHAPAGPVIMESTQQYLAAGAVAVQLALLIRELGWRARAHIDGNYLLCCPLVARDAGLGEIGRMGLLMTPTHGPRVRLAVVTCDLPLEADARRCDPTVHDFCRLCRKCADVCPSDAIPHGEPGPVDGVHRWRIDQARCYEFWCRVGTDCGRCMQSCPYSHPETWLHRPVRWLIRRSHLARRLSLFADDFLYGRRPPAKVPSGWWIGRG